MSKPRNYQTEAIIKKIKLGRFNLDKVNSDQANLGFVYMGVRQNCRQSGSAQVRKGETMGKERFIGTWKLVSSEFRRPDGEVTYPLGRNAVGIIMYDATGHMSVQIMRPDRPAFASGDQLRGTPMEIKSAFEGFVAYYGTYEVDEEEGTVTHHVEGSSFPNWVGLAQRRFFEFSGNRLTLSTPPILMGGQQVTAILVWERAE